MLDYLSDPQKKKKITRKRGKHVKIHKKHHRPTNGKVGGLDYLHA